MIYLINYFFIDSLLNIVKLTTTNLNNNSLADYWDHISEYEIDSSWKEHVPFGYSEYRENFTLAQKRKYDGSYPISIEIEGSYHCNLQCPFCPRFVNYGQRNIKHMSETLWHAILDESKKNNLSAILMDHEAESLMNPRIFEMIKEAKNAGIMDIWLHTNANMLNPDKSEKLITSGLTKINFSIDACDDQVYEKLRVGGDYQKVISNIKEFLKIKLEKNALYLRTRVSFIIQKENAHQKKEFFELWKNQSGLNMITFQDFIEFSRFSKPDEDWSLNEKELEKKYSDEDPFYCSQPWEMPVVDVDGNVVPCGSPTREHTEGFILGNLSQGSTIESCWKSEKMQALKRLHQKGEWYKNPMCRVCVKSIRDCANK